MRKRVQFWAGAAVVVLVAVLAFVPGSWLYLPDLLYSGGYHYGRSSRAWARALDSDDPTLRHQAIFALGAIGPQARSAVPALATILTDDPDPNIRNEAALALSKMTPASEAALPALIQAVGDDDPWVRVNAMMALSRLGEAAHAAVPSLIEALQDKRNQRYLGGFTFTLQEKAALALGRTAAGRPDAVAPLRQALHAATSHGMRIAVARALGNIGPAAEPAMADLTALLDVKDRDVRETAQEALDQIGGRPRGGQ